MTTTSQDDQSFQHEPTSTGQLDNIDLIPEELQQYAHLLTGLTTVQHRIIWCLVENMTLENPRSETEIADDLGIARSTIMRARKNPRFQQAMAVIIRDSLRGLHDKIVGRIIKAGEKDWQADKFLLQYDGSFIPKSQSLNINANMSANTSQSKSFSALWDDMLIRAGELGWGEERIQELADGMAARFTQLRSEGAF